MLTVGKVTINVENAVNIRVDRISVLGNPFRMSHGGERDTVCDKYREYFNNSYKTNNHFKNEVNRIFELVASGSNVNLQCWCSPKRCHADYIKEFIDFNIRELCRC